MAADGGWVGDVGEAFGAWLHGGSVAGSPSVGSSKG
jgi:hypothetical protein